ncbi:hypothetical protein, partial [Brevibacillus sp. SIMBA_040]|uniref:hypothetical protein n=1 Tax=Brevibacillus sp. SIMBA_040 TaxID=3085781 RepID=UPI00397D1D94
CSGGEKKGENAPASWNTLSGHPWPAPLQKRNPRPKVVGSGGFPKLDAKGVFLFFHCSLVGVLKSFASFSLFLCELWILVVFLEDFFGKATMKDIFNRAVVVGRKREKTLQLLGTLSRVIPGRLRCKSETHVQKWSIQEVSQIGR